LRHYHPVDGASPRLVQPSPQRAVAEISDTGEQRVIVLVPGSCADQVAAAFDVIYQAGRDDLGAEAAASIPEPLLIDQLTAGQVEGIVRAAGQLWFYDCEPSVLNESQRAALDQGAALWYDDHAAAMRADHG
jgi:hypothetical protein